MACVFLAFVSFRSSSELLFFFFPWGSCTTQQSPGCGVGGKKHSAFYTHLEHDHQKQIKKSHSELQGSVLAAAGGGGGRGLRDPPKEQQFGGRGDAHAQEGQTGSSIKYCSR